MTLPADAGVGFKAEHFTRIQELCAQCEPCLPSWFEVHPENYMGGGGIPHRQLGWLRKQFPLAMHGVGLSLGSTDGLDDAHVQRLAALVARYEPAVLSEHLAWSHWNASSFNDLLPVPYTRESLAVVTRNIHRVQEATGRSILIENPSRYLAFAQDDCSEAEFLNALCASTGCDLLLDINNLYVSACNLGFSASSYLATLNTGRVREVHLAGHSRETLPSGDALLIDDHGSRICADVWSLYGELLEMMDEAPPTLIEWDTNIPDFGVLQDEVRLVGGMLKDMIEPKQDQSRNPSGSREAAL